MTLYRITFRQQGKPAETRLVHSEMRISEAAAQAGFNLRTHCGGTGTCGKCHVLANNRNVLACQTVIDHDFDVFIPDSSLRTSEQHIFIPPSLAVPEESSHTPLAVRQGHRYGIALDLGTTTLAAELHDCSGHSTGKPMQAVSCINPQRIFGDDVITRIHHVREHASALTELQRVVVRAVNEMIAELTQKSGLVPQEISTIIAAGNTVMQSLFFGIDPSSLGESPFRAPTETFPVLQGDALGLTISAEGVVSALPIFGGFVGGDIVAGVLTLPKFLTPTVSCMLLDIGTNGEIVLSHGGQLFTAATAAGPAFEGAKIEYGTLAVPGAIDHVEVSSGKISISTIGCQPAVGICGSGLIDAVAVLLEQGIILPSGRFAERKSAFELVSATQSGIGESILLTQRDIREVQLAAGAIKAGLALLLQSQNVLPEMIETFYVAGGFGQSIRLSSARRIGLLPSLLLEKFQFCGNTSLSGARAVLLHPENENTAHRLVQRSHHCELATLPQFQKVFAESMQW